MRLRSEAILPVRADQYWEHVRNDPDFHKFEDKVHKTKSRTVVSKNYDKDGRLTSARTVTLPDMKQVRMPSVITGMLPNGQLVLTDEWRLVQPEPNAYCTMAFTIRPNVYEEDCKIRGRASFFQLDSGHCRHVVEAHINVDIFLIGSVLESAMANKIRESHTKQPAIVAEYLKHLASTKAPPRPIAEPATAGPSVTEGSAKKHGHVMAVDAQKLQVPQPGQEEVATSPVQQQQQQQRKEQQQQEQEQEQQQQEWPQVSERSALAPPAVGEGLHTPSLAPVDTAVATPRMTGHEATQLRHLLRAYHSQRFRSQAASARTTWAEAHGQLLARKSLSPHTPDDQTRRHDHVAPVDSASSRDAANLAVDRAGASSDAMELTPPPTPSSAAGMDTPLAGVAQSRTATQAVDLPSHAGYGVGKHAGSLSASPTDCLRQPPQKVAAAECETTHMPVRVGSHQHGHQDHHQQQYRQRPEQSSPQCTESLSASPTDSLGQPPHKVAATESEVTHMPVRNVPQQQQQQPSQQQFGLPPGSHPMRSASEPAVAVTNTSAVVAEERGGTGIPVPARKSMTTYSAPAAHWSYAYQTAMIPRMQPARVTDPVAPRAGPTVYPVTSGVSGGSVTRAATAAGGVSSPGKSQTGKAIPQTGGTWPHGVSSAAESKTSKASPQTGGTSPHTAGKDDAHQVEDLVRQSLSVHTVDSLLRDVLGSTTDAAERERANKANAGEGAKTAPPPPPQPTPAPVANGKGQVPGAASTIAHTGANNASSIGSKSQKRHTGAAHSRSPGTSFPLLYTVTGISGQHSSGAHRGKRTAKSGKDKKKSALDDIESPWEALFNIAFNPAVWEEILDLVE